MTNYPMGAENDPRAPYNQTDGDDLCIHCNYDEIAAIARDEAKEIAIQMNRGLPDGGEAFDSDDFYDACFQDEMDARSQCRNCYLEEHADDWEEDI